MQNEKGSIFITDHEEQEERSLSKAIEQTLASPPTEHAFVFLRLEKILPGSAGEPTERTFIYSRITRCTDRDRNPNIQSTSWCLEWSLAVMMLCFHLSSYIVSHSTEKLASSA